jgi:hypothetical protein
MLPKSVLVTIAVLFLAAPARLAAQTADAGAKPVLVVSVASVEKLLGNVDALGTIAQSRLFTDIFKAQAMTVLDGIDLKRPIGFVVLAQASGGFDRLGFVPVADYGKLLSTLGADPPEDGVSRVRRGPVPLFLKQGGGWAFVCDDPAGLAKLPAAPETLLAGQEKEYDIAARGLVRNLPEDFRTFAIEAARSGVDFAPRFRGESDDDFELRKQAAKAFINQLVTFLEETEHLTVGWSVDAKEKKTFVDVNWVAVSGSKSAKDLARLAEAKSKFAGFILPDAAVAVNISQTSGPDQIKQFQAALRTGRERALRAIERDKNLPDDAARQAVAKIVGQAWDVLEKTAAEGSLDAAAALLVEPTALSFIAGVHVADGEKLEASVKQMVELARNDPGFRGKVQFDSGEHGEARLHTIALPIADPDAARLLGSELNIVLGFAPKAAYVAMGKNAAATLTAAIDKSAADLGKPVAPWQLTVATAPLLDFAAAAGDAPRASGVLRVLAEEARKHKGKDRLLIVASPIPNGLRFRLEVEEGLIALAGKGAAAVVGGGF